jgi:hypothetical protein
MSLEPLRRLPLAIKNICREKAQEIKKLSQEEVPKKSGTLHDACEVSEGYFNHRWFVKVRYRPDRWNAESGAWTGSYMVKQHEYTWLKHPYGGKSHFLIDPFNRVLSGLSMEIKTRMRYGLTSQGNRPGYGEEE